jgi:hypothetical protein
MHIQRLEGEFFPGASQALYATAVLGDLGDVQILFVLLVRSSLRAFGVQSLLLLEVDLCVSARNHQCRYKHQTLQAWTFCSSRRVCQQVSSSIRVSEQE